MIEAVVVVLLISVLNLIFLLCTYTAAQLLSDAHLYKSVHEIYLILV